ncbi:MAG: VOC family protein [Pirellulales bacterium]|nr:VOC family protein [Pirellulales bacterium]
MKLGYVILYVPSVAEAVAFYEKAFGLSCRFQNESDGQGYAELETGQTVLAFASDSLAATHGFEHRKTSRQDLPPSFEIALVTEEVQQAYDRAVDEGSAPIKPPTQQPWGQTVSYVRDLNGYLVEICSPVSS